MFQIQDNWEYHLPNWIGLFFWYQNYHCLTVRIVSVIYFPHVLLLWWISLLTYDCFTDFFVLFIIPISISFHYLLKILLLVFCHPMMPMPLFAWCFLLLCIALFICNYQRKLVFVLLNVRITQKKILHYNFTLYSNRNLNKA